MGPQGNIVASVTKKKCYIISRPELAKLNQGNELAMSCRLRKKTLTLQQISYYIIYHHSQSPFMSNPITHNYI